MKTNTQYGISRFRTLTRAALCVSIMAMAILSMPLTAAEDEHDDHEDHDHPAAETEHDDHDRAEPAEHPAHADHDDHDDHDEGGLRLSPEQRRRFGISVQRAAPGSLRDEISLPGEIIFNEDSVVHMVPRVSGIVRKVNTTVGDRVKAGDVLAVIDSRELADAKAEYLAARARTALARKTFAREKELRDKQVSSEQDFLEAEQAFAESGIALTSAEQKLHALGFSESAVAALNDEHGEAITRYEIRTPIDGVVTEKHIALGESVAADTDIFTVVDTGTVWVNLTVHTKHLAAVRKGRTAVLRVHHNGAQARGQIAMVTPFVQSSTRSATARMILDNADGQWIPGTFVTGSISVSEKDIDVVIPRRAVQTVEGRTVVFREHEGVFEMTAVKTGRSDSENIEIIDGLKAGDSYVADGAFELKATIVTSSLDSHAGHGH